MSTLKTTSVLRLDWDWADGSVTEAGRIDRRLVIDDSAVCSMAWSEKRSVPPRTTDAIDTTLLHVDHLGSEGDISFSRVHKIYIANFSTADDAVVLVGTPSNMTVGHYAMSVYGDSFSYLFSREGWIASDLLRIANPTDSVVEYGIALLGTGVVVND